MSESDVKEKEFDPEEAEKIEGGLAADEQAKLDQIGAGLRNNDLYDPDNPDNKRGKKPKGKLLNWKRVATGGAIGGGITGIVIAGFLALLPLKINHIVENIQSKFFAPSKSAVQRRTERLFSDYVKKKVLPGLNGNCPTTKRSRSCALEDPTKNKLSNLWNGWRDANLEGRLADKYGIEFEKRGSNVYIMKIDGIDTDISDLATGKAAELRDIEGVGRSEVRAKWMAAIENESRWTKVLYRFKVGRLLERKYGVKRCLFACEKRDQFANWQDNKAKAAKVMLAERVLTPRSAYMGLLFECMINAGCNPDAPSGKDGEKRDVFQQRLDAKIAEYASSFGSKEVGDAAVKKLIEESDKLLTDGYRKYIIEKIFKEEAAASVNEAADKALPVIGWINTISSIVGKVSHLGGQYRRWVYITNATAMVAIYMNYVTQADELKSGNVDVDLLGSMVSSLGPAASDNHPGQGAETSPLYANLFGDDNSGGSQSALGRFFSPKASAEVPDSSQYTCDDGNPPEKGKLICSEETLTTHNAITNFSDALNKPPLDTVTDIANFWNSTAGKVLGFLSTLAGSALSFALDHTPGYNYAKDLAGKAIDPFLKAMSDYLLKDPFTDMSGARAVNMAIGGGDVAGNYFAHFGLGGKVLTPIQVLSIRNQQAADDKLAFAQQPLWTRLFGKDEPNSLLSHVAMTVPTSTSFFRSSLASLSNPFSTSMQLVGSIFSGKRVSAQDDSEDPFGVSQYGYPLDDPAMTADPATYTDDYCTNADKQWTDSDQFENPDTGVFEHTTTNPCRLESDAITSAGALFTDSVLDTGDTSFNPGE